MKLRVLPGVVNWRGRVRFGGGGVGDGGDARVAEILFRLAVTAGGASLRQLAGWTAVDG